MKLEPVQVLQLAWQGAEDKKALDPVILEMKNLTLVADYFFIVSGRTDLAVRAIADGIMEKLAPYIQPKGKEGYEEGRWILLDYGAVIVHVFLEQAREYYDLERLWADAPRVQLQENV
ncbi:MAG TPA: ribosome silencing factor, partial [Bacillota bacterium]|nr:ribosome silencing factor [Bacillota bacterium]